jgi:hypothetical protein
VDPCLRAEGMKTMRSITSVKIKRGIKASVKNNKPEEVTSLKTGKKTRIRL